jgi:hypothetical protein
VRPTSEELRELIDIKQRMNDRRRREEERAATLVRIDQRRVSHGRALISPSGMAHLARNATDLEPACVHYEEGRTEGWHESKDSWAMLPHDVARCRSCIALS